MFALLYTENTDPVEYVKQHNLGVVADSALLEEAVSSVLEENANSVGQYLAGNEKVAGFLMGKVMAKTAGKADPAAAKEILLSRLKRMK